MMMGKMMMLTARIELFQFATSQSPDEKAKSPGVLFGLTYQHIFRKSGKYVQYKSNRVP